MMVLGAGMRLRCGELWASLGPFSTVCVASGAGAGSLRKAGGILTALTSGRCRTGRGPSDKDF